MSDRANPFAPEALPAFAPKPKAEKPLDREAVERVSRENNFPSRQAPKEKAVQKPKPRRRRTGRNQQINIKTTADTIAKIYRMADERQVSLGEILELSLAAYEKQQSKSGGDG